MRDLPKRIMDYAQALPEATPLCPGVLLQLGRRAAIDQALSRLSRSGELMRICQGVYRRSESSSTAHGENAPFTAHWEIRARTLGRTLVSANVPQ